MEIGGWKTPSMFRRYAIVNNDDKRRAMEALAAGRCASEEADEPRISPSTQISASGEAEVGKAVVQ